MQRLYMHLVYDIGLVFDWMQEGHFLLRMIQEHSVLLVEGHESRLFVIELLNEHTTTDALDLLTAHSHNRFHQSLFNQLHLVLG